MSQREIEAEEWQAEFYTIDSEGLDYWISEYAMSMTKNHPDLKAYLHEYNRAVNNIKSFLIEIRDKYDLELVSDEF